MPAAGFYEWQRAGKTKQPYFIKHPSEKPLAMAGLWESWRDPAGEIVRTFCIITTAANATVAPIHDRMLVLLRAEDFARWLDPTVNGATLVDLLVAVPVSQTVGTSTSDGPSLIVPAKR